MFDKVKFNEYEQFFFQEHPHSFELLDGNGVVIISTPHSVEQTRHNRIKHAEPQTGVLAKMLHDALNCPIIYKTKNCGDDANYDEHSTYKQALVDYIKKHSNIAFLIDLHQLSPTQEVKISIGTGKLKNISNPTFAEVALNAFTSRDLGVIHLDKRYTASYPFTVSSYIASHCKISCIQIEINSDCIQINKKDSQIEKIFEALVELINNITKIVQGEKNEN